MTDAEVLLDQIAEQHPQYICMLCEGEKVFFESRQGIGVHFVKKHKVFDRDERDANIKMYGAPQDDRFIGRGVHIRLSAAERRQLHAEMIRLGLGTRSDLLRKMMELWFGTQDRDNWKTRYEQEKRLRLYAEEQSRRTAQALDSIIQRLEILRRGTL